MPDPIRPLERAWDAATQADAEQGWPLPDGLEVPPSVWVALREAQENWEAN